MRYLILSIALLAMTVAFADGAAAPNINLTVQNYCAITADAATMALTATGNQGSVTSQVGFHYSANRTGHIRPTMVENPPLSDLNWSTNHEHFLWWTWPEDKTAVAGSVNVPVSFTCQIDGIDPSIPAGVYSGTLTATISIP